MESEMMVEGEMMVERDHELLRKTKIWNTTNQCPIKILEMLSF